MIELKKLGKDLYFSEDDVDACRMVGRMTTYGARHVTCTSAWKTRLSRND